MNTYFKLSLFFIATLIFTNCYSQNQSRAEYQLDNSRAAYEHTRNKIHAFKATVLTADDDHLIPPDEKWVIYMEDWKGHERDFTMVLQDYSNCGIALIISVYRNLFHFSSKIMGNECIENEIDFESKSEYITIDGGQVITTTMPLPVLMMKEKTN